MGLMDKVKHQAEQAVAKAQQGVTQGQAKLDQLRHSRDEIQMQADLDAVEDEVIAHLLQIRAEVAGAVAGTGSLPAARRALWKLFEGFVLHDQDGENLPDLILYRRVEKNRRCRFALLSLHR